MSPPCVRETAAADVSTGYSRDPVVAYIKYLASADKSPSVLQAKTGIFAESATPKARDVSVGACSVDGDEATIEVSALVLGSKVCGRVVLHYDGVSWKASREDYMGCSAQNYCIQEGHPRNRVKLRSID